MKKILIIIVAFLSLSALSACNTAQGFGKDLETAGRGIQDSVN